MLNAVEDKKKAEPSTEAAIADGMIVDYISREPVKETPKEKVRQRIARALFHEYGIDVDDMAADFRFKVDGRNKKVDIAVFEHGQPHEPEHLRRVVVCKPEPKLGKKGIFKMRDHEQATKDLDELKNFMTAAEGCDYGLWTNGLDLFFLKKRNLRFDTRFEPIGDWPLADETIGTRDVASAARARRADAEMLRIAFRRCHNFIHGNEGMPKDAAFWQFLYLIFAKLHDEEGASREARRFYAHPTEQFDEEGRKAIRKRIIPLFDEVKAAYPNIFRGNEEITLSDRALAFMVSELAKYDFVRTEVDAKGAAYQEIVGTNLRGDRGQYFTPRGAIKLAVDILDPKPNERFLDPACGTGGFLVQAIAHLAEGFRQDKGVKSGLESTADILSIQERLSEYAKTNLFGADFDQFLVRAAQMNIVMASGATANVFHLNSLEYPKGHLDGLEDARREADLGTIDVLATNPPFGSDIPVTDPNILGTYDLAHVWERTDDGGFRNTGRVQGSVAPEILFIERCLAWLKPGGRMAIVLPDGILGNPGDEYIRWWILRHAWVLASVDLPVEVFIVEANVNILTSILVLKKKTAEELRAEAISDAEAYPVFMAVAEKVGFDRRGNTLYKRSPDGEELLEEVTEEERIRIGGEVKRRTLQRKRKIVDDDLPVIAEKYEAFRERYEEPGA